eukprot:CAMPEP_0204877914 /NCGR_PEP_ID=MMETSP1348-20121228/48454_1 /ASSEMBLY_ACC=CAM_ASM_000700 /TAXON_ID=215587 /ORGANISM="Aplanochytrium stocchinoi, Strain GSBS06" /LENGTH=413 /DNA_ID=CAMNT_0052034835 /DNA_START=61 /DNA_END=1303 /DNA_ORIENTATION=-
MSFHFLESSKALVVLIVYMLVTGLALGISMAILSTVSVGTDSGTQESQTIKWIEYADYVLNFFPAYALGGGLFYLKYRFFTVPGWYDDAAMHSQMYAEEISQDFMKRILYMITVTFVLILYIFLREKYGSLTSTCWKYGCYCCKSKSTGDFRSREENPEADDLDLNSELLRMQNDAKTDILQVEHLSKGYRKQQYLSVDDVSFGVKRAEVFGFLGSNGAGKSSTLNIVTGMNPTTTGHVRLCGVNVVSPNSRANITLIGEKIGYCTQEDNLFPHLSVYEHIYLFACIHGYPEGTVDDVVKLSIERMQLGDYRFTRSRDLSGGNKRKLMTALALLGAPRVVILDEPSSGMDPLSQRFLWNTILNEQKRAKVTFLLTTHSMEEVEALCDRGAYLSSRSSDVLVGFDIYVENSDPQ